MEKSFYSGLVGLVGFSLLVTGCSEPTADAPAEDVEVAVAEPVAPVLKRVTAGDGILIEGHDATLDVAGLNAACDISVAKLQAEFDAMKAYEGPATIETVVRQLDLMGEGPGLDSSWAYLMSQVHPDAEFRAAANDCVQRFVTIGSEIGLSREIYDLFKQVDYSAAGPSLTRHIEDTIQGMEDSGVDRDEATRDKIKALQQQSFAIGQEFGKNIREDVRSVEITQVSELDGLPEDYIAAHQPDENGIIRITTSYPDYYPVMTYAHSDDLRAKMRLAYGNRAYPQNEEVLRQLLQTRWDMAKILGYEDYASMVMEDRMIETPANAESFVDGINAVVRPSAGIEKDRLLARYRQIDPDATEVKPWQRGYINEIVRKEKYQYDTKEVRQYFQYDLVKDGIFTMIQDLFDLEIRKWETSTWDPSVEAFEVYLDGKMVGRFYLDMHPRDGKYGHAAQFRIRTGVVGQQIPMGALVCNFPGGDGTAGLMSHYEVSTFLHEFGHLIHNMMSGTQEWYGFSGMSMERDFVEAPSQMLEEWIWDYETVSKFARNETGEVLPQELFDKMSAARNFGLASGTAGQTFLAAVSLNFYNRDPATIDMAGLHKELYEKYSVYGYYGGTHTYANFGHLSGYSSNYYTYQWSNAIAADLFTRFKENGLRDKATAISYRDQILGAAGSKPAADFIEDFLGRPWSLDAYEKRLEEAVAENK